MPTEQQPGDYSPLRSSTTMMAEISAILVVVSGVVFFIGVMIFAISTGEQEHREHRLFIGQCMEFHAVDRCHDFWRYGRLDLGRKP